MKRPTVAKKTERIITSEHFDRVYAEIGKCDHDGERMQPLVETDNRNGCSSSTYRPPSPRGVSAPSNCLTRSRSAGPNRTPSPDSSTATATISAYSGMKCRCQYCRDAMSAYRAERRAIGKDAPRTPRHRDAGDDVHVHADRRMDHAGTFSIRLALHAGDDTIKFSTSTAYAPYFCALTVTS